MSEAKDLLLQNLPQIERLVALICRRSGMDADATEDFTAEVKLRLVDDDYAVIRAFQNRSSFDVYMAAVIRRLLVDRRNHEWGKWRVSAAARRLGPMAVELERLLYRDWRTTADAVTVLNEKYPDESREELERLALRIPPRVRRLNVSLEHAVEVAAPVNTVDAAQMETAVRLSGLVCAFIDSLEDQDQLIMYLRFQACMSVAQVARALHIDQQLLYRRLQKNFDALRDNLVHAGISKKDVEELIGKDAANLDFHLKKPDPRPSGEDEHDEHDEHDGSTVAVRKEEIS
jgi:RNA polymerase sigma factor for flagellar operon FliA